METRMVLGELRLSLFTAASEGGGQSTTSRQWGEWGQKCERHTHMANEFHWQTQICLLSKRQSDDTSLAFIPFLCENSHYCPFESLTFQSMDTQTQRVSHSYYPLNICFCLSLFFSPPPAACESLTWKSHLSFGPPWLPVNPADSRDICLYKEAVLLHPSFPMHVFSLSLSPHLPLCFIFPPPVSVSCDNSLICQSVGVCLGMLQDAYRCKRASELWDWVNKGTGAR